MKESILKEFEEKFVKPTDSGWEIENKLAVFYIDYIDAKSFISQALDRVEKEALIKWTTDFMKCDYARVIADQTRQETIQRCIEAIKCINRIAAVGDEGDVKEMFIGRQEIIDSLNKMKGNDGQE